MKKWTYLIAMIVIMTFSLLLSFSIYKNFKSQTNPTNISQTTSTETREESFDINSIELSGWDKNDTAMSFWFPKKNITVTKNITNSYIILYPNEFVTSPIKQSDMDIILNFGPTSKISQELEKQNFTKLTELSGLFANSKDSSNPYYLITYKKNNTICQINFIFECSDGICNSSYPKFGCANFDLEKDYQIQKQYYQLISTNDTKELYSNHKIAITSVSKNPSGYLSINSGSWSDGGVTYFDGQNNKICDGKPCCDESSKDNPDLYGKWCTEDYQTLETYQPVGL